MGVLERLFSRHKEIQESTKSNEVSREDYLNSLPEADRKRVMDLVTAIGERAGEFEGFRVGVIAFGSSVKPSEKRHHPVRDIDLRVITSAEPKSNSQKGAVETAVKIVWEYLEGNQEEFDYHPTHTIHTWPVKARSWDPKTHESKEELVDYLDYRNNDPSFETKASGDSLPLHISISGPGLENLDDHLREEQRQKQYFSVISQFPVTD